MSLINDALKKAQSMQARGPGAAPQFPGPTAPLPIEAMPVQPMPAPVAYHQPRRSPALVMIAGSVVLLGLMGGGFVLFNGGASPAETPAVAHAPAVPAPTPPTAAPTPAVSTPIVAAAPAPTPAPEPVAPVPEPAPIVRPAATVVPVLRNDAPRPAPAPMPVVSAAAKAPMAEKPASISEPATESAAPVIAATPPPALAAEAPAPAPVVETPPEPPAAPVVLKHNPQIQNWVAGIRVGGIRAGTNAKVLMNDRVYAEGDTVNFDFDVRLTAITAQGLEFVDPNGLKYELRF